MRPLLWAALIDPDLFNSRFNILYQAKPQSAEKQNYEIKLFYRCDWQGCQSNSVKLPRTPGSFHFYRMPHTDPNLVFVYTELKSFVMDQTSGNNKETQQ